MYKFTMRSKQSSSFVLIFTLLAVSIAAGSIEEADKVEINLPGTVFIYHANGRRPVPSPAVDPSDAEIPDLQGDILPSRSFFSRRHQVPAKTSVKQLGQSVGSERVKVLGRALDEGGMANDVLSNGNYCNVGTTGSLIVFDVTDPLTPVQVHEIEEPAFYLGMEGSLMTVTMGRGADLVLFDVSDPTSPGEISRVSPPNGFFYDVNSISDSLVVVVGSGTLEGFGYSGLMQVIDISDPHSPQVKSSLIGVNDYFRCVKVVQDLVFLTTYGEGLTIFDVSNPENIIQVGFITVHDAVDDMVYLDGLLYLAGNGMEIVDVSDPGDPTMVSQWGGAYTAGIVVSGGYAYITDDDDMSIHVVDVSDPVNPQKVGELPAYGRVYNIDIGGNSIYLPDRVYGLLVVDVSNPEDPSLLSMTSTGYLARAVDVEGGLAAVNINMASVHTLDVSDPFAPEALGSVTPEPDSIPGNTLWQQGIDLADSIAVTSDNNRGIRIYDVSVPTAPEFKGKLNLGGGGSYYPSARLGNLVYTGRTQIVVIDITDLENPVQVGTGPSFSTNLSDIQIVGDTGYASSYDEVVIFDLTDPLNPTELSRISELEFAVDVAVIGDVLGIARIILEGGNYVGLLDLYDVSDLFAPLLITSFQDPDMTPPSREDISLAAEDGHFYLCGAEQLMVIDATDPANASLAAVYPEPLGTWWVGWVTFEGVTVSDGLIYLAGYQGVEILRFLDVGVFLDPASDPLVVPQGGNFSYEVRLENFTETQQTFDAWIDVILPGGGTFGPVAGPVAVTLNAGQSVTATLEHQVPLVTPPGTYLLYSHVGTYPGTDLDNDRFSVEVVAK